MEFFDLGYNKIYSILTSCLDAMYADGMYYALWGLSIGILLSAVCYKLKFFFWKKPLHRYIRMAYYFYIPFLLFITGFTIGATKGSQKVMMTELKPNILPMTKLLFPAYQHHVNMNWSRIVQTHMTFYETLDEYLSEVNFQPRKDTRFEKMKMQMANTMVPKITGWSLECVTIATRDIIRQQNDERSKDPERLKALSIVRELNIFRYPPKMWENTEKLLSDKMNFFFQGIIYNILFISLLLLSLPFAEITIYKLITRRRVLIQKQKQQISHSAISH